MLWKECIIMNKLFELLLLTGLLPFKKLSSDQTDFECAVIPQKNHVGNENDQDKMSSLTRVCAQVCFQVGAFQIRFTAVSVGADVATKPWWVHHHRGDACDL